MKIRHSSGRLSEKIPIDMTPMIDIVFQLMAFFIMTLKVIIQEGDFNIKMPAPGSPNARSTPSEFTPIPIRLTATADGRLAGIHAGNVNLDSMASLRMFLLDTVGDPAGPASIAGESEVELDFDDNLRYEHVIAAVTHITGYVNNEGQIVPLIEKIKFAPPPAD